VLQALREETPGRLICVFGAGGERDKFKRPLMGHAVDSLADLAVVTNDNPRGEEPRAIIADILSGFDDARRVRAIPSREEAIDWALSQAEPGDCVLIAGKGHERHQIIGKQALPFDDREFARGWLYEHQPVQRARAA
jgi:UDP-N-acetylmuramoyl-L-alanyl-D-glutamate--2,6-diaminopimelate ligase